MPTYEYLCPACDAHLEIIHGVNDPPPRKCPECGARRRLIKQLSAPAFQFKGSGWYVTDYARKDTGGGEKSPESGGKDSEKSPKESESAAKKSDDKSASGGGKKGSEKKSG